MCVVLMYMCVRVPLSENVCSGAKEHHCASLCVGVCAVNVCLFVSSVNMDYSLFTSVV